MADISIRRLDPIIHAKLRRRAMKHRISMEEEARRILAQAVSTPDNIEEIFAMYFGQDNGVDLDLPARESPHRPIQFD